VHLSASHMVSDEASARARGARARATAVDYAKPPWSPGYGCRVTRTARTRRPRTGCVSVCCCTR
jgi:hypothetical protein